MTIRNKFGTFTALVVLVTSLAFASLDYRHQKTLLEESLSKERAAQSETFVSLCRQALTVDNELFMVNYVKLLEGSPGVSYAYFADDGEKIVVHSNIRYINKALREWNRPPGTLEVSASVQLGARLAGRAVIGFSQEYQKKRLAQALDRALTQVAAAAAGLAAIGIVVALLLAYMLTKPLKILTERTKEIAKGDFRTQAGVTSSDEVGQLAQHFNSMARGLAALDELKDDFISSVSHDLRNPLSAITMYTQYMLNDDPDRGKLAPKHKDLLLTIMDNTQRLGVFVNNILDTAKIKAGRMQYHPQPVRLQAVAQRLQKLFGMVAQQRKVLLLADMPANLPDLLADPEHIDQVVANLFSNALKFTPEGGKITIGGREAGDRIEVFVSDTGKGIAPADLPQLFQRFKQFSVSDQKKEGTKGTGLGLYIVKKAVEDMAGSIRVESELGRGTRFTVSLPRAPLKDAPPPAASAPAPTPPESPGARSPMVLVVDDEPYFAQFAKMLLESHGYRALLALTPDNALSLASSEKPDLVLLDLGLPGIGGAELLRRLKADPATAKTPVILCSISQSREEIARALSLGAADFLPKPLNTDDFRSRIGKALAARGTP